MLLFNSPEELLSEAKQVSSKAPQNLKESIEPYFVSRYFVAVYEARHGEIPIQVWNEYRNALDHLFRYLVSSENDTGQINSAHKHFLRAALDILKLHIHKTQESTNKTVAALNPKVVKLVDNGEFITYLNKNISEATNLFELAKINDSRLGDDKNKNSSVLKDYLNAAFAFEQIGIELNEKQYAIKNAMNQYETIHETGHKHSIKDGILIHVLVATGGSVITLLYQNYSSILQLLGELKA